MEYPDPPDTGPSELKPCGICGRTFRPEALTRHEKVCEKNAAKKRKVFDSSKQRALEEGESRPQPPKQHPPPKAKAQNKATSKNRSKPSKIAKNNAEQGLQQKAAEEKQPKKSNWREKHEELIETIKRARGQDENKNEIQTELKKKVPSDYVQCPACQRNFNQRAAERHIPWCEKKKAETPKSPAEVAEAKEKLFARVKYRPPQGKSRLQQQQQHKPSRTNGAKKPPPEKSPPSTSQQQQKGSRSSPPNLLDNRNQRTNSLDRVNNNVTQPIYRRRSGSRSREKEPVSSPELPLTIIKFKERFPNHISKRNVDLETSLTSEQLRELLTCRRGGDRCPKTVPGVRLSGGQIIRNENDSWNNSWNKRSVSKPGSLPEVSSSELPGSWAGKACWDLDQSVGSTGSSSGGSSSGGSLPPLSRESADDPQVAFYCHQCSSRFPLIAAKYCCECGARRRGYCIPQTV